MSGGETREQIIADARDAVAKKPKNWYVVDARLDFMTYEMPEDIIVLPYRGESATTVATAAESAR